MRLRLASAGGFSALVFLLAGCSDDALSEVKGKVTVDGAPIEEGAIMFHSLDKTKVGGSTAIKDGEYAAKVSVGRAKVVIHALKETGEKKKAYDAPGSVEKAVKRNWLPDKFARQESTVLEYDVKRGQNVKDWELTTK